MVWVAVAAGGALGSLARHGVNVLAGRVFARALPWATASVNLLGAAVIGLLAGLIAAGRLQISPVVRAFVFVGILGGFTTFSSFMLDTLTLAYSPERTLAFANVAGQVVFGFAAAWGAYQLALALR